MLFALLICSSDNCQIWTSPARKGTGLGLWRLRERGIGFGYWVVGLQLLQFLGFMQRMIFFVVKNVPYDELDQEPKQVQADWFQNEIAV